MRARPNGRGGGVSRRLVSWTCIPCVTTIGRFETNELDPDGNRGDSPIGRRRSRPIRAGEGRSRDLSECLAPIFDRHPQRCHAPSCLEPLDGYKTTLATMAACLASPPSCLPLPSQVFVSSSQVSCLFRPLNNPVDLSPRSHQTPGRRPDNRFPSHHPAARSRQSEPQRLHRVC